MMRRLAMSAAIVACLVLAGCAPAVDHAWAPPEWPGPQISVVEGIPAPLDAGAIAGLVDRRIRNDAVGLQARWTHLPGAGPLVDPFNDAVDAVVRAAIDARVAATSTAYAPQVFPAGAGMGIRQCIEGSSSMDASALLADPALGPAGGSGTALACDIVVAQGPFLGQRLRVVTGTPDAVTADTSTLLYADTQTGEAVPAAAVWSDGASAVLAEHLREALLRDAGYLTLTPTDEVRVATEADVTAALATTVPAPDGGFVITLPGESEPSDDADAPTDAGPITIEIDPQLSSTLASPFGARLLASAGASYTGPARGPASRDRVDCGILPCVALTYDDGPSDLTPAILDQLAAHSASATFFVMGQKAARYASVLQREIAEGHLVENHSWSHPHLTQRSAAEVSAQIADTNAAIVAATGVAPTVFRPPYGDFDAAVLAIAGMPAILWNVDTRDWAGIADDELIRRVVDEPTPGSIVLQHDIQENTARTAGAVYEGLLDRGYMLVNIAQLFGGSLPASGAWRSAR
jgi:peptidoglycan/xylan/chitin deacetylase (PgdA/CDA1 family)